MQQGINSFAPLRIQEFRNGTGTHPDGELIHVVQGSELLLQAMQSVQLLVQTAGGPRCRQSQLEFQTLLPSPPGVKGLHGTFLLCGFPPGERLAQRASERLPNPRGIGPRHQFGTDRPGALGKLDGTPTPQSSVWRPWLPPLDDAIDRVAKESVFPPDQMPHQCTLNRGIPHGTEAGSPSSDRRVLPNQVRARSPGIGETDGRPKRFGHQAQLVDGGNQLLFLSAELGMHRQSFAPFGQSLPHRVSRTEAQVTQGGRKGHTVFLACIRWVAKRNWPCDVTNA